MDELTANQFIASLVKSVQALCNGYIDFSSSIEVVGHIHLNIDHKVKLDYVLAEEVNKSVSEDATLFSSRSYHSRPPASLTLSHKNSAERLESSPCSQNNSRRRKSHHVPRIDDSESFSFTTIAQDTSHTQANENILAGVLAEKRTDISYSDDTGTAHKSTTVPNANKDSRQTVAASGPSTSSRGRRCETSSGIVTSGVKRKRSSEMDSKSDHPDSLVVFIKEEPEDFSLYPSSTEGATAEDTAAPDFSSIVMESLDHSGQKEVTSFVTGDQGQHLHLQHQPYPIMLHATPETSMTPVSVSMPGPSTNNPPIGPTSTDVRLEGLAGTGTALQHEQGVQTPYTVHKSLKNKALSRPNIVARRLSGSKAGSNAADTATLSQSSEPHTSSTLKKCHYLEYTVEDMNEAIELVHGGMSVIDAALKYGIPRATLFNRSRDGCKTHSGRCSEVFLRTHVGPDYSKKRVKSHYTAETMEKAILAVHEGMPVIDAAILYGIPRASLFIRSGKGCPTHPGRCSTVASDGKMKRSKVSRFRYLQLMQQKSVLKSTKAACNTTKEMPGKKTAAKASGIKIAQISPIPDRYNPKVKLVKIIDGGTVQSDPKIENDDNKTPASVLKNDEIGASKFSGQEDASSAEPHLVKSSSDPAFNMSMHIPEPTIEMDVSELIEPPLEMDETETSDPVFETLPSSVVVKIERDDDDE